MRIVAGKYRHREIIYPDDSLHIRPTKDRIREALFSALGPLDNLLVLDLYSGSGAMGIEAISRGANKCIFVDNNKTAYHVTKENINNLGITNYELLFMNDFDALEKLKNNNVSFDLVILDPPYKSETYIEVISFLINNKMMKESARIVTECNHSLDFSSLSIKKIKEYHYGEININILYL